MNDEERQRRKQEHRRRRTEEFMVNAERMLLDARRECADERRAWWKRFAVLLDLQRRNEESLRRLERNKDAEGNF